MLLAGSATSRLLAGKKRLSDLSKQLEGIRKDSATKRGQIVALEREEQKVRGEDEEGGWRRGEGGEPGPWPGRSDRL